MQKSEILSHVDHTLLATTATWPEIRALCDDGLRFGVASVCLPPCYVARAKEYVGDRLKICTVIGFPNGYHTAAAKCAEAAEAAAAGADELDMVVNLGMVKAGEDDEIVAEIAALKKVCGDRVLKVIVETCRLTEEEKIRMCAAVARGGADYIKTSTGFSTGGATREDVALLAAHTPAPVKVKAAGGIRSWEDAEAFLALGADRLGTSALVKLAKQL